MTCDLSGVMFEGIPIKCSSCGGAFHTLTSCFQSVPPMRGSYLRMMKKYRGNGWYAFPERDWVVGDNVQCPRCGNPYKMDSIVKQVEAYIVKLKAEQVVPPQGEAAPEGGMGSSDVPEEAAPEADLDADFSPGAAADDIGIYDSDMPGGDLLSTVMKMTAAGETQASIAETCQISVYMVRQIQNGKKV